MAKRLSLSTLRESFSYTPQTLALAWQTAPHLSFALASLTLINALTPLAVAYVGKLIIDAVVAGDTAAAPRWVLAELGIVAIQALGQRTLGLTRQLLGGRLAVDINLRILTKAQTLDLQQFENPEFYDQLTRARREASSRPLSVIADSFLLIQHLITLGGYIVLLLSFNAWAVAGLFIAALPAAYAEMHFSTATFRLRNRRSSEVRRLNYIEYVLANDAHVKEVKLFGLGPSLLERYSKLGDQLYREDKQMAIKRSKWAYSLSLLGTIAFYLCYGSIALAAALRRLSLGDLTLYVAAFRQGQQSFLSILTTVGGMYENNLYMSNLFSFFALEGRTAVRLVEEEPALSIASTPERGLRFEHVSFRYEGQEAWALEDINLFIPAGQSLALVGHNGAGKTTFIKLLTRLYEPSSGRILLDGRDLRSWDLDLLRQRMAIVFQDFNRYQLSLEDNVTMGSLTHAQDLPRVERAIESGGASELVQSLKEGLKTPLGRWFQDGIELSGGQWQKIALSRAFMREDADILILDEPTAALDAEAEFAVFERFKQLTRNRTSILISHRFPTVRMADSIIVIDKGRIIEQGRHEDLMAKQGRYAQLFRLQASGYF